MLNNEILKKNFSLFHQKLLEQLEKFKWLRLEEFERIYFAKFNQPPKSKIRLKAERLHIWQNRFIDWANEEVSALVVFPDSVTD